MGTGAQWNELKRLYDDYKGKFYTKLCRNKKKTEQRLWFNLKNLIQDFSEFMASDV